MDRHYDNIIGLARPVHEGDAFSVKHPKMTRQHRAKIFAPFAALDGFSERVRAKEVRYRPRRIPDAEEEWAIEEALRALHALTETAPMARMNHRPWARVECFEVCADAENEAFGVLGQYSVLRGIVLRVDPGQRRITLMTRSGRREIDFVDIGSIRRLPPPK